MSSYATMRTGFSFMATMLLAQIATAQTTCNPNTDFTCPIENEINYTPPSKSCVPAITDQSELNMRQQLFSVGIRVNKCPCPAGVKWYNYLPGGGFPKGCTSVGGLLPSTLRNLEVLANEYSGNLLITGGNELGHSSGHTNGVKVDLAVDASLLLLDALSVFINGHFDELDPRTDGTQQFGVLDGPIFGLEYRFETDEGGTTVVSDPHWDVLFPPTAPPATLTVDEVGSGFGTVSFDPAQVPFLFCGTNCTLYTDGINVLLTAQPDPGTSVFGGWSDVDSSHGLVAQLKIDDTGSAGGDQTATVDFDLIPPPPPGNSGCWAWVSTINSGLGGYVWTCTGPPPPGGGTPPTQGCWRWDASAGSHGAWLHIVCGGGCVKVLGQPSSVNLAGCHSTSISVTSVTSGDPNDKDGSQGVGSQQYLSGATPLTYAIFFGNEPTASGAAQTVSVTDPLSMSLDDLKTFAFGPISFGDQVITPPPGTSYSTTVDLRPGQDLLVGINANLNPGTGAITWKFASLDPSTHAPTTDPTAGFLPPGGNGSISFTVKPKQSLSTGTEVLNQATVVFDLNAPINTPTWLNTLDSTPPVSAVSALPSTVNATSFPVVWSGSDKGSGIATYSVYVATDGGAFTAWLTNFALTTASFTGVTGHTYGFYSVATDLVGNIEAPKTTAEATTTVQALSSCGSDVSSQIIVTRGGFRYDHATQSFVQTLSLTNNGGALSGASLVLDSLSPAAILTGSSGKTACEAPLGSPWISVPGTLKTGQSVSLTLTFSDPTQAGIQYSTRVLAGNGQQ